MSFYTRQEHQGGFTRYFLGQEKGSLEAEIIPSAGGILNGLHLKTESGNLNLIDGYDDPGLFGKMVVQGFKSAKLSPFVCRLREGRYRWRDKEYHLNKFVLQGAAIHGLLYDAVYQVTNTFKGDSSASISMRYQYAGDDPGYPFPYLVELTYQLEIGNRLSILTGITNTGSQPIPIADGWHPYFRMGNKVDYCWLYIGSDRMLEYGQDLIPTGHSIKNDDFLKSARIGLRHLDNGFLLDFNREQPLCVLENRERNIRLEIEPDTAYPYLQIYTPDHRNSIAIENLSSAPDAFNNGMGLIVLQPGEKKELKTAFSVR